MRDAETSVARVQIYRRWYGDGPDDDVFRGHSVERIRSLVSFKSQFSASQDKAHNRNIATKIHEEMAKLRAGVDASPTTPRRWVWELIQNAKDVNIEGKVC